MIRAGTLDRKITIERASEAIDDNGTPQTTWAPLATLRAELVTNTAKEFIRQSAGAETDTAVVFRTHWLAGITTSDRVTYDGAAYDILQLVEIGRRRGLELHCLARSP